MKPVYNIYITAPENLIGSNWLIEFEQKFKIATERSCQSNINITVKDPDMTYLQDSIERIDFFITILNNANKTDESYINELYAISDFLSTRDPNQIKPGLFKICLTPAQSLKQPAFFESYREFNFFEISGRKETIAPLDFDTKQHSAIAWNMLIDMSFELNNTIEKLNQDISNRRENNVYLSMSYPDITSLNDEIKRELQYMGFNILPTTNLTFNNGNIETQILDTLANCSYVVQILGGKYGTVPIKERISIFDKENYIISREIKEHHKPKRLIWIPESLERIDQKQRLYINRVKQNEPDHYTEIIESSMDEFKEILYSRIKQKEITPPAPAGNIKNYLININDEPTTLQFIAARLNIYLTTLDRSKSSTLYNQHLKNITECDNIIIEWNNNDPFWLKSKLRDLIKAPGLGKKELFNSVSIVTANPIPDLQEFSNLLPEITTISSDNEEELKSYFLKIIE